MTLPSALIAPVAAPPWSRQELEAAYREALDQLSVAQLAARESAHAAQIYGNRIRSADAFAAGLASTLPEFADAIADLRALLVGGMS
jgi:hypothetical protein